MKFHWFNLMPWPYLPDDFREKHRSVWVDVDSRLYDPVKGHQVYNEYLDLLEFAADLGFDGIGVPSYTCQYRGRRKRLNRRPADSTQRAALLLSAAFPDN